VAKKKLLLIYPGNKHNIATNNNYRQEKVIDTGKPWLPPLPLLTVAAMTPNTYEVEIWDEFVKGPITSDNLPKADIYGIGGLTPSRKGAYRTADIIRRQGGHVVAGGMDVTGYYEEGYSTELHKHFDAIVPGRLTSKLWEIVLNDFEKGNIQRTYKADKDEPWEYIVPRHDLVEIDKYFCPAIVRSSDGCNEACHFCTVHLVIGKRAKVHAKPADILREELTVLPKAKYFIDAADSFGADYDHTVNVVLPLYKEHYERTGARWLTEMTVRNLLGINAAGKKDRDELIKPMANAGCIAVYIGIENIYDNVSHKLLDTKMVEEAIRKIHDAGMLVVGSFLLDASGKETKKSIKKTVSWVIRNKIDFVQYSLLALLPGSMSKDKAVNDKMVIDSNPEHMDGAWPTVKHQMTPMERIEALSYAYCRTNSLWNILRRLVRSRSKFKQQAFVAAANWRIRKSARDWAKVYNYDYWVRTQE